MFAEQSEYTLVCDVDEVVMNEVSASSVDILAEGSRRSLGHDDVDPCLCNGLQRRRVRTNASRFRENPDSASIAAS